MHMKIKEKLLENKVHISFEVFPPKTDAKFDSVMYAVDEIAKVAPSFISVTYGAGGGTSKNTVKIASHIQNDLGVDSIAHLTCVSSTKEQVEGMLKEIQAEGIQNIMALRGDIPEKAEFPVPDQYHYAYELIQQIKNTGDLALCTPH